MKSFEGFRKGVNLGGWLSQCDYSEDRLNNFIREEDFAFIASRGLDHVRLPFDFNVVENAAGDGFSEAGFAHLDRAVAWSRKYNLNIVLDLHKTAGFSFDPGEKENGFFDNAVYQERFFHLWEEMARRYGNDPQHVAFELLNEVTDKEYSAVWNRIADECIDHIRAIAPDVVILVGSYWNNHASAVKDLAKPHDDKVVYNFHCYEPLFFTHQGARWVHAEGFDVNNRMTFEESGTTEEYFENMFAEAIAYAEANNTVLYCGEYGVIDVAQNEDILKWYTTINAVLERHNIGRAAWSYRRMNFGLSDEKMIPVLDELVKVM